MFVVESEQSIWGYSNYVPLLRYAVRVRQPLLKQVQRT